MTVPPIFHDTPVATTAEVGVADEKGGDRHIPITQEYPLTLYINKNEVVTLMTLGCMPAELALGWIRNQGLLSDVAQVQEVRVDWEVNSVVVYTHDENAAANPTTTAAGENNESARRVITSGCGQGSIFSHILEEVEQTVFVRDKHLSAAALYDLLGKIREYDTVYKRAGAVHGCALAEYNESQVDVLLLVEDIGRHNAVDSIAGWMWLNEVVGDNKVFYTTGRLTSEMVIKCAQMKIPYLVSRSGVTGMGYQIANKVGLTMLGRAINRRYFIFSGAEHFSHQD